MGNVLTLIRGQADGKYDDVLDVAEVLARGNYGSVVNANAVMVRQSPLFKKTKAELDRSNGNGKVAERSDDSDLPAGTMYAGDLAARKRQAESH